jgi:hypothetical protein
MFDGRGNFGASRIPDTKPPRSSARSYGRRTGPRFRNLCLVGVASRKVSFLITTFKDLPKVDAARVKNCSSVYLT